MQPGGRPTEVAFLGDRHEVAQAPHVDAVSATRHATLSLCDMIRVGDGRGLFGAARHHGGGVKIMWFHLMPYPDLPEDFNKKHRSVWVDIDPALFDPDVIAEAYDTYIDQLVYAEECGFDGLGINEHHTTATG